MNNITQKHTNYPFFLNLNIFGKFTSDLFVREIKNYSQNESPINSTSISFFSLLSFLPRGTHNYEFSKNFS